MKEKTEQKVEFKRKKRTESWYKMCAKRNVKWSLWWQKNGAKWKKRNWKRCGWCLLNCVQNFLMALLWCHVDEYLNFISDFTFCLLDDGVLTLTNTSLALSGLWNYPLYNYHGMVNKISCRLFHIFIRYDLNGLTFTWRTVVVP